MLLLLPRCIKLSVFFGLIAIGAEESSIRGLIKQNRLNEAVGICRQYEVLSTKEKMPVFDCVWAYYRSNYLEVADKILEKQKRNIPATSYQLLSVLSLVKREKWDEARSILDNASFEKESPDWILAQEFSAEIYEAKKQMAVAAFIYKQIVVLDPKCGQAHLGLSRYFFAQNDSIKARFHLGEAARLWPKDGSTRLQLAQFYLKQENYPEVTRWIGECYALDKGNPEVLEILGLLYEKKGKIADAVRYWRRAVELKKDTPLAKQKLATYRIQEIDALVASGHYEKALSEIQEYSNKVSDQPLLLLRRGLIQKHLKRFEKASADLFVYLKANPKDTAARRELGICYVNQNRFEAAGNEFLKAVELEPQEGLNFAWLGWILEARGEFNEARQAWLKALDLLKDPLEVEKANRRLASIEKKMKRKNEKQVQEENSEK